MAYDLWFTVCGCLIVFPCLWFMVYGLWFMVCGLWFSVFGFLFFVLCFRFCVLCFWFYFASAGVVGWIDALAA